MSYTYPETDKMSETEFIACTFVLIALLVCSLLAGVGRYRVAQRGLAAGYPASRYTVQGTDYCVKRLDNTDVVVPVESAR